MAKINILPAKVYNRIAAGEVVDRPYSVVKELVENSLDAGATEIEIYIENGGTQLIRVVDNGCGIEHDDLYSAFLPHATSKIAKADDLENIITLGFRGEAVASIASVSKMTITSKIQDAKCYSLTCDGGNIGDIKESAGYNGTDVKVEMLFYNTPVRLKFLKKEKAEEADITNFVSRFILSRPNVSFTYYVNGKKVLQSFGGGEEEAIVGVYGASILQNCYRIDAEKHGLRVRGYIGNQNFSKPNKTYQSVFLNGRYILNTTISAAISNAYMPYLMKRQYPFYVLHIDIPTEIVDVNVHPNKADVRFADNQIIYGCIFSIVSAVLDGNSRALDYIVSAPIPEKTTEKDSNIELPFAVNLPENTSIQVENHTDIAAFTYEDAKKELQQSSPKFIEEKTAEKSQATGKPKGVFMAEDLPKLPEYPVKYGTASLEINKKKRRDPNALRKQFPDLFFEKNMIIIGDGKESESDIQKALQQEEEKDIFAENKKFLQELEEKAKQNKIDVTTCKYVGKLFNTYLLYERNDEIYIIDQHAAHERLIYDKLRLQMAERKVAQQPMLLPFELRLNAFEATFIKERMDDILSMGFDIQEDGETNFKVYAVPVDLQKIDLASFFNDILGDVSGYRAIKLADILKDKLATAACKAAVKGGMDLTQGEIDKLFSMMDGDMGLKCPHGRPVVVKMTKTQIEKMFKRIV